MIAFVISWLFQQQADICGSVEWMITMQCAAANHDLYVKLKYADK